MIKKSLTKPGVLINRNYHGNCVLFGRRKPVCALTRTLRYRIAVLANDNHYPASLMLPCDLVPRILVHVAIYDVRGDRYYARQVKPGSFCFARQ